MKALKIEFPEKCIGCQLCIFETQRQLKKVGLEDALIRIFKREDGNGFLIAIDPRINSMDITKIKKICPTGVFELVEEEDASNNGF